MGNGAAEKCIRCCNAVPVTFVCLLIVWSYYAYVVELCIMYVPQVFAQVLFLLFYHCFLAMFVFAYFSTMFSRRMAAPPEFRFDADEQTLIRQAQSQSDHAAIQEALKKRVQRYTLPVMTRTPKGDIRFCLHCSSIKPDRTHHCSTCGRCVLRMDHHCVWTGTCIGFHNHKQFVLFLIYTLLYAIYIIATMLPYAIAFLTGAPAPGSGSLATTDRPTMYLPGGDLQSRPARINLVLLPVISVAIALGVGMLTIYQVYLISRNRTGLESLQRPTLQDGRICESLFDGGLSANWRALFGSRTVLWFIPIFSSDLDGISYATRLDNAAGRSYRQLRESEDVAITM